VENIDINAILNTIFVSDEGIVISYVLKRELNIHLSELLQYPFRTLANIVTFNKQHSEEVLTVLFIYFCLSY
jgi:hypothetical protein